MWFNANGEVVDWDGNPILLDYSIEQGRKKSLLLSYYSATRRSIRIFIINEILFMYRAPYSFIFTNIIEKMGVIVIVIVIFGLASFSQILIFGKIICMITNIE